MKPSFVEPWFAFVLTLGLAFTTTWAVFGALYGAGLAARKLLIGSSLDDPWLTLMWAAILGLIAVLQLILGARTLRRNRWSMRFAAVVLALEAAIVLSLLLWAPSPPAAVQIAVLMGVLLVVAGAAAFTRSTLRRPTDRAS
jgi:hypothetical protein